MRKFVIACLSLASSMVAMPAAAQSWGLVQGNRETIVLVDETSIRSHQGKSLAWAQYVYRTPIGGMSHALVRYEIDCPIEVMSVISFAPQSETGKSLPKSDERRPSTSPVPGTLESGVLNAVCHGKFIGAQRFSTADSAAVMIWPLIDELF